MSYKDDTIFPKELVTENNAPKKISHIQFGLFNSTEMHRLSEFEVCNRSLFQMPTRNPAPYGVLDPRLGVSDKVSVCQTCRRKLNDCAGHYGNIRLELPVFHIGYFNHTLKILQAICKSCARVLLAPAERAALLKKLRHPRLDALGKLALYKRVVERGKKADLCPRCGAAQGPVKKVAGAPAPRLVHERFKAKFAEEDALLFQEATRGAARANRELAAHLPKAQEDLPPTVVLDLFKRIPDEDAELLWMSPLHSRPERLILEHLLVPPVPIRPSVAMDVGAGSNEDDLTMKLQEVVDVNAALRAALAKGASVRMVMENWDFLQYQVAQFINGDAPGLPKPVGAAKPPRGLCQRLKGKAGRFRGNLSGKRVDFSGRTVISPDPNLRVDQVGVPLHVARTMTYPEMCNRYNLEKLRRLVLNGPHKYPGANYLRPANQATPGGGGSGGPGGSDSGFIKSLAFGDRERAAQNLRPGDVVERHLEDGDVVLFNRQPSLHKMSIMAHRAKVMPYRTFRFNECVCAPYNADFDGDEMNLHCPQTEEARAEAIELMGVQNNLTTPKNGEPLVSATQDFLTGGYLLTQKDYFLTRGLMCQLASYLSDAGEHVDVPVPAVLKPVRLWTGKQVASMLIRPNKDTPVLANFELKERNYSSGLNFCRNDGYVQVRNSYLVSGNWCKKTLGDGSKKSLYYVLIRDHGPHRAAQCMNRLAKLCARFLGYHRGFSIGIEDVTPSPALIAAKREVVGRGYAEAEARIALFRAGKLPLKPGCNPLQSLESELNGLLGRVREAAGKKAMVTLPWVNSPRIMAECGSKGSPLNISQMAACVGQQAVGGKRIENGFVARTLPHFKAGSLHPAAKGFVKSSFFDGLSATEFFFHTMGGREGLVDTAVKTAETGYMARRLMKALEDLSFRYDATVRNSEATVVQFRYGDDGLHPQMMEGDERPVDFERTLKHVLAAEPCPEEPWLAPAQIRATAREAVQSPPFQALLPNGEKFLGEVEAYFAKQADRLQRLLDHLGLAAEDLDSAVGSRAWREGHTDAQAAVEAWQHRASDRDLGALLVANVARLTPSQAAALLERARRKYLRSCVEPGEAVGAIGAQSISEPGTQMTLKTFHFAGVASMNVTLGVPRLREIINAAKNISTPIITASLVRDDNKTSARIVKGEIEKTTLGQVSLYIKEVYAPDMAYISVKLDMDAIQQLHLNIDARSVRQSILKGYFGVSQPKPIKLLKDKHVLLKHGRPDKLRIVAPESKDSTKNDGNKKAFFMLQQLKTCLPGVIVKGIPSVSRAVINEEEAKGGDGTTRYHLLVEGYGLSAVMGAPGVDGTRTQSNHVIEVEHTLGIEAARTMIQNEISYIMSAYGIDIDKRHLILLSDVMTFKGEVLGITRFGVSKMRESVLMLASFEKTTDHLFDAAVHGRTDAIVGVSECIIMGVPIPVGTGLFKLLLDPGAAAGGPSAAAAAAARGRSGAGGAPFGRPAAALKRRSLLLDGASDASRHPDAVQRPATEEEMAT